MQCKFDILNENSINDFFAHTIKSIPDIDNKLFHAEHGLRHPLATYNVLMSEVYNSFSEFLLELKNINEKLNYLELTAKPYIQEHIKLKKSNDNIDENVKKRISELEDILKKNSERKTEIIKKLLDGYKKILDSIMAFIDGTYLILKAFYPVNTVNVNKDIKFAHEWLRYADKNVNYNYYNKVKEYRDNIAIKVNKTKHNAQKLDFVRFKTQLGMICGYFIEGVDPKSGAISSDQEVHRMYNGEYTAISF
ncbi:hypothetical protein [Clostridium arbusti]|uniref:hypothetical protein n=1 Tax=Clostridium arbusti TaxID=1137848 RepID=UPI000287AA94|nr:hypothetical protein [Clostridium arbusti]